MPAPVEILTAPQGPLMVGPAWASGTELSVVVPTFQESENIGLFLGALCEALDALLSGRYEIMVMDDDSPDGTLEAAAEAAAGRAQIRLARRTEERGLATAVIRGWQLARGRVLSTINADFQHPPEIIAGMWELAKDADVVIASRYCRGGGVGDWVLSRRLYSRGAQLMGRLVLPKVFCRVTDPLSGCYMCRRAALAGVELKPIGYKSLIEVLARGRVESIAEFPYQMQLRRRGASKANSARSLDYILQLFRLRKALRRACR